jgi:hypothetical protein
VRHRLLILLIFCTVGPIRSQPPCPARLPLVRAVDLKVGEAKQVVLCNKQTARVKLRSMAEQADTVVSSVRGARVVVEVNGERITLDTGNYRLRQTIAGVQIDCPITRGYLANSGTLFLVFVHFIVGWRLDARQLDSLEPGRLFEIFQGNFGIRGEQYRVEFLFFTIAQGKESMRSEKDDVILGRRSGAHRDPSLLFHTTRTRSGPQSRLEGARLKAEGGKKG